MTKYHGLKPPMLRKAQLRNVLAEAPRLLGLNVASNTKWHSTLQDGLGVLNFDTPFTPTDHDANNNASYTINDENGQPNIFVSVTLTSVGLHVDIVRKSFYYRSQQEFAEFASDLYRFGGILTGEGMTVGGGAR